MTITNVTEVIDTEGVQYIKVVICIYNIIPVHQTMDTLHITF